MKIPDKYYKSSNRHDIKILEDALKIKDDSEFLKTLKELRKNSDLINWNSSYQIAGLLDRCDSILAANNDLQNRKIVDETVNTQILKFLEQSFENSNFFRLFCSLEYVIFILDNTDTFKNIQLCIRICQSLVRFSDESNHNYQNIPQKFIYKEKLLDYVKLACHHINTLNGSGMRGSTNKADKATNSVFQLCEIYYDDPRIEIIKQKKSENVSTRKDSTLRKGSVQGRILKLSTDVTGELSGFSGNQESPLEQPSIPEHHSSLPNTFSQLNLQQITLSVKNGTQAYNFKENQESNISQADNVNQPIPLFQQQQQSAESEQAPNKTTEHTGIQTVELVLNNLNFGSKTCVEIAEDLIKQHNLSVELNSAEFCRIRTILMFLKYRNNDKERNQIIHFFINSFKILIKNKNSEQLSEFNSNNLLEQLVNILYLKSSPKIHAKIVRFIRYYFKSYIIQNFDFFRQILIGIASLKLDENSEKVVYSELKGEECILPLETACDQDFQKKFISMIGEKYESQQNINFQQQIAESIVKITGNTSDIFSANPDFEIGTKSIRLLYSLQVVSKARQILINLIKNEEVNREYQVFEKHILPQLLILLSKCKIANSLEYYNAKENAWKKVTNDEYYETLSTYLNSINSVFRNSQNQRGNQTLSRKIVQTNIFEIIIDTINNFHHLDFFINTLVFVYRLISEQPQLINSLVQKGLIKLQVDILEKEEIPLDISQIKSIIQFMVLSSIVEEGKAIITNSKVLTKIFSIFTQKKYVECITAASIQSDPNIQNPLLYIAENIARNIRCFEQNPQPNEKPAVIDLIIKTFENLIKQKEKYLEHFQNHMQKLPYDSSELEFGIQEYPQFSALIDNFCKFYQALCQKDQYFIRHSETYQIYSLFLQLVKFPVLDLVDSYSKKGFLGYMINIGQNMGSKAILDVHAILKKEFQMIQKMLGCTSGNFSDVKDLQSVISNELFYKTSTLDHQKVFENPDPELVLPVQLFNSLNFVEGLIKILYISIRQKQESKISANDFGETLNQMQQLYVILTNQQNNELMYNLHKKYEEATNSTDKAKIAADEAECLEIYNQTQGIDYLNNQVNIYSNMRALFKILLQTKTPIIKPNTQQEVYAKAISKIIQNINPIEQSDITDLHKLAQLNVNLGHIILFVDVFIEEAKKKGQFQQEYVLDLNLFAQLCELKILDKFIDHVKSTIKLLSGYRSKDKDQTLREKLIHTTMVSLTDKVNYIINNLVITYIDISQEVYINAVKLSDLGIESILNGINFYFIEQIEETISECIVPLQQESTFISLVEVLFQKVVKVFNLVGKNAPLIIDIQQSLLEKKRLEEEERKKKFNADVKQLEEMGFPKRRAIEALRRYNNINEAIDSLASQRFAFDAHQDQGEDEIDQDNAQNAGRPLLRGQNSSTNDNLKKSFDLGYLDNSDLLSSGQSQQIQAEQKIKRKNTDCLKTKIKDFRENVTHLLLENILKFDKSELLVCDIILKYLSDKVEDDESSKNKTLPQQPLMIISDSSNKVTSNTTNQEIVQIILWNFRQIANNLTDSKSSIKISNKILSAEYKPKIVLNIDQSGNKIVIGSISYLSRILLILTKIGQKSQKSLIYKKSLGEEIMKFCCEITEKKLASEILNDEDQQIVQQFFLRCVVYAHNMIENLKVQSSNISISKKNDQSVSSLQANSNKDDSMLSKNSKKKSKKEKSQSDIFKELINFLQKILEISVSMSESKRITLLHNKTVQGIISILTILLQRNWKHFSKDIYESQILNNILKLKNIGSLDGVLEKLCHLYTLALNDDDVESVSLEAQIKSFFLYHKHALQGQQSAQNKQAKKETEDSSSQVLKESAKDEPIRIPLDTFLQKFANFSQVISFRSIYNKICTTKKIGGKEYTELNKDIDIHRCQIPASQSTQGGNLLSNLNITKKKSNTNSQNSSIISSSQMIPSSLQLHPTKMDFTSNFILKNQYTSNFLNLLLETFITKITQRIQNSSLSNKPTPSKTTEETAQEKNPNEEKQKEEEVKEQIKEIEEEPSKKVQQDTHEIDEGILLYLIHYLVKKFPILSSVISKYKIYKIVQKVIPNEEECNNLLLIPWQNKSSSPNLPAQVSSPTQLNFIHFLTRVVMKYCQNFSRDLLLDLCIDTFVMRSSHETYANEVRKQVSLDIYTFLDQPNLLDSPSNVHNLITFSQLHCVLLNLKQFKNSIVVTLPNSFSTSNSGGVNTSETTATQKLNSLQQLNFIKVYNNILSQFKVKQYYSYESIIPFIYHPLSILNRYALQNILIKDKKNLSADVKYIYQTANAQFIPIKYGNSLSQTNFAAEWQKTLQLSESLSGNQYDQQLYEQQLGYNQAENMDQHYHNLMGRFGDFIEVDDDPGELEIQIDNHEYVNQDEEERMIFRRIDVQDQEQIEQEEEEDEENYQQADLQPRMNYIENQMLILENSLSQDPNRYILEPDMEDGEDNEDEEQKQDDQMGFEESEEGMSELDQGNRLNQQLYEENVQVGDDQDEGELDQEEDIQDNEEEEEEDEEDDLDDIDDEGDYDQMLEEHKSNIQNATNKNQQGNSQQGVEKDIKKYLKFDEKTLFCQQQINFALHDLLKKLMKNKLLGKDLSGFYEIYSYLESHQNSYFQKSVEDWKNLNYNYTFLNKPTKSHVQRIPQEINEIEQYQGLINELIQRDPSDYHLRNLIRQIEEGRRNILNHANQLDAHHEQQGIEIQFGRQDYENIFQNMPNRRIAMQNEVNQTNEQIERDFTQMMRNMRDILISDVVEDNVPVLPNLQPEEQAVLADVNAETNPNNTSSNINNNELSGQIGQLIINSLESPNLSPSQQEVSPQREPQQISQNLQPILQENIEQQQLIQEVNAAEQEQQAANIINNSNNNNNNNSGNLTDIILREFQNSFQFIQQQGNQPQNNIPQQVPQQQQQPVLQQPIMNEINFQSTDFSSILNNLQSLSSVLNQLPVQQVNQEQQVQQQNQEVQNQVIEQQQQPVEVAENQQPLLPPQDQVQQPEQAQEQQQEQPQQEEIPEFLQRSQAILQQFNLDLGFFERNELDPLYFDELPDDIKIEIILNYQPIEQARQEQLQQQRQLEQNQQNQQQANNNQNNQQQNQQQAQQPPQQQQQQAQSEEMDTATFLASLPPQLRDEILLTTSQDVLQTLPPEMRQHAIMLQQRGAAFHNQEVELNEIRKREQKKVQEQQRKKEELKQKFLKIKERRDFIVDDSTIAPLLIEIADESVMERIIELLYIGNESFINYPFNLLTALQENPYAEYKLLDAMMFILRSPGIVTLQNQYKQQQQSEGTTLFPPSEIIQRSKEALTSAKDIYVQIAQKILFLFCKITDKHILYFIDSEKAESRFKSIKSIAALKDILNPTQSSSKSHKMPYQDLTQLLTSKIIFDNTVLLELLIKLLHNISKKYYTYYFAQPQLQEESTEASTSQMSQEIQLTDSLKLQSCQNSYEERQQLKNLSIKSICQVLSSDHLSKLSVKKISDIINYMCIDELNLAEFIGELKNIIMVFTEDINLILDENLPPLRINPKDQKQFKNIQDSVHGVSKVQKMFSIVKELFEKSQVREAEKPKEQEEEEEEESKDQSSHQRKEQEVSEKESQLQKFNKEQNIKLNNIREKIQLEFNQLAQDRSLKHLWINLAELFSIIGDNHNQAISYSIVQTLQPLLESFLIIQFNIQNKSTLDSLSQSLPMIPNISPQSSKHKGQGIQASEELQIAHLHFKDVRERSMGPHQLFYFVCEKSKAVINVLIRNKLKDIIRRQNYEIQHRNARGIEDASILKEPVGLVFKHIPRIIDFDNKKLFFSLEINKIKASSPGNQISLSIRRKEVLVDSYYTINQMKSFDLKQRLRIQFEGEEGIDAGGLTREWFVILSKEIFNPNYCLFLPSQSGNTFQPNPNSHYNTQDKQYFEFVGRIVGKALFDGYMLDAYFTRSFYKHILGQEITYHDIQDQDNEFYKNMKWIIDNDVTPLELTFVYQSDQFGKLQELELKPNGKDLPVTEDNKQEYVHLICKHRMTIRIQEQINFFLKGFHDIIPKDIISVFDSHELELMISGLPDIDLTDLKENTEYHNYQQTDKIIQWFWEIMSTYDRTQKAAFIQFVTGTSKVPLEGFSQLRGISGFQKFQIHKAYSTEKLPTTHTCFNQLDLPEYPTKEILIEKLNYAIQEGKEGFGFA